MDEQFVSTCRLDENQHWLARFGFVIGREKRMEDGVLLQSCTRRTRGVHQC